VSLDVNPTIADRVTSNRIGIDPGFSSLLSFSDGTKVAHPRELETSAAALARAHRGGHKLLAARIQQRIANQRRDRNHKLSRKLISENVLIVFSDDNHKAIARSFGKSVTSSGHAQLRSMLAYKSRLGGTQYIEVASRYSTRTCSACGSLSGPAGYAGLKVRRWVCQDCGVEHDRDCNAAVNTLRWGEVHPRNSEIASNERCAMTGPAESTEGKT
jgi:putative transposase